MKIYWIVINLQTGIALRGKFKTLKEAFHVAERWNRRCGAIRYSPIKKL